SIIIPAILTIDNKPYTVAQLMPSSFENNKLKYASIPPTVTEIPSSCFYRCFYLEECLIPGAKSIGPYAFFRSTISKIELSDSLEEICSYAFYECNHLRTITLPATLKRIGHSAFRDCRGLDTVIVNFRQPIPIHEEAFWGLRAGAYKKPIVLVVPTGSKPAFEADPCWKRFTTIIERN
ncbi:MAG: leucine-rich repeat domain-containing protein, partial [Muribaculaceae bacterium]